MTRGSQSDSNEQEVDTTELAEVLKKSGVITKDTLQAEISKGFENFGKTFAANASGQNVQMGQRSNGASNDMQEDDIGRHLRGECGNPDCDIGKEAKKIYSEGFTRGAFYGTKLGGFAAKKGVFL